MPNPQSVKIRKEMNEYFSKSVNVHENTMYQFFKNEIMSNDIKISQIDESIIGYSNKTQKYVCAIWRPSNYYKTIPWVRIGIPNDHHNPSIEVVLPIFSGDMPDLWSKGKKYFRLVMKYSIGKHGPAFQMFTNSISKRDMVELLEIIGIFYRKIKSYDAVK